ncbi:family 78 glycoside hydrolase catalytic domain [Gracilibacillus massiliensis]|uniref:family 78 glycoside hydrolase catalytic domain n=1 Tax=Gracilibacillus massiliensis TaxID=1564956 RepID=UPI00071CE061|nr:family 78 glycoside hydrolase catalytic domain [Gracilibacillus massiliensis]
MLQVQDLRTEYRKNPIGIDVTAPRISWKLSSDKRNVMQASYQIQVAEDDAFEKLVWNSGKVDSDKSNFIALTGVQLESRARYYFRVKVTDTKENVSEWSDSSYFEMGLLNKDEWVADWIAAPLKWNGEPAPKLARSFQVNGNVKKARIYVTALGLYELQLNGKRVGEDYFTPGWTSYQSRLQYQTYDVTDLIASGDNEITGLLGNGWYKGNLAWEGRENVFGDRLSLLAQIHIELENGEELLVATDDKWAATESSIRMSELYHGETIDASFETDQTEAVEILEHSYDILVAQENEPVRKIETLSPKELIQTPNGETVIDFGQNMVGWVSFDIEGEAGQEVQMKHAEILDGEGNFYTANLRTAKQTNTFILSGNGKETFEPSFSFQGFRYVQLIGFNDNQLHLKKFRGVVLHSDMEITGDFKSSDPIINQLQHNILWGLKGNFLDVPTDCPQRDERLGWTGDAQMFIRTASYIANVGPFFTKWLRDVEADQDKEGGIPFVVPNVLEDMEEPHENTVQKPFSSAAWGDAAVICPWTLYLAYGDKRILEEQYHSMTLWISYIKNQGENPYLWNTGFHFGDWLALDAKPDSYVGATDRSYIATAFFAYSTSLVKRIAKIIGKEEDYSYFAELQENIIQAFTDEFITPNGKIAVPTQTAQILALMFNLVDTKAKERAVEKLEELLEESNYHLTTGFVGTPYLNHVLTENGMNDAAYTLLFQKDYPSWLYQITKGATTIWEHWDGIKEDGSFWSTDMNSFNHYAYGAIGDWLYRKVAGLELDEEIPGFKHFTVKPYIGDGLEWAEATLESMYGEIKSGWKKDDTGNMQLEIIVPPNTNATVKLLGVEGNDVKENGKELSQAEGVLSVNHQDGEVAISLGSGKYLFTY